MSSRRVTLNDSYGEIDRNLRDIISENPELFSDKYKNILVNIIKNELSARQSQIIMLYYFKGMNICEISSALDITPAAVSITMKRARNKLFRILKYTFKEFL